jgi:hypothetical protein
MKKISTLVVLVILLVATAWQAAAQCSPQGNQTSYGNNNVWIAYNYQGKNFDTYKGYTNEGTSSDPSFDESFGGSQVNFNTNGCTVYTEQFSVRYKLSKNFNSGSYTFTVGGDDGYRLSLDGGATWVINNWTDHGYTSSTYTATLNGNTNMVLEFYENGGENRVSFSVVANCTGDGDPSVYGTNNKWMGYLYQGMNFDNYKGWIRKGSDSAAFDDNFGNVNGATTYYTSNCSIQTQYFSARYRLTKNFKSGTYMFTVGGDDGFRLSLDGGATWVINRWNLQSYTTSTYTATLSGTYNMVLEYYQNAGFARLSVNISTLSILPVKLNSFEASAIAPGKAQLAWTASDVQDFKNFEIQRSADGKSFTTIGKRVAAAGTANQAFTFNDDHALPVNYYRLAMVDYDGSIDYSAIKLVTISGRGEARVYPTIADNKNIYVETGTALTHAKLVVFDLNGRKLQEQNLGATQTVQPVQLNNNIQRGSYIVGIMDNNSLMFKQTIIVR